MSRKPVTISLIVLIITTGTMFRMTALGSIRSVDLLTILACGASIGVFVVHLTRFLRTRNNS
jgi:hypothetical protein